MSHWYGPEKGYDGPSFAAGRASRDEEVRELVAGARQLLVTLRKDDYRMTGSEIAMTDALAKFKDTTNG